MQLHRLSKGAIIRGFPASALQAEARKGRLELVKVANRYYVTDDAIDQMVKKCAVLKAPASNSKRAPAASPSGESATERKASALVYLRANATKRKSA
jgi:hypothetical protein